MALKDDAARFRPNKVPSPLEPGERATAIITMLNTGETSWTRSNSYDLRPARGSDEELWADGNARIDPAVTVDPPKGGKRGDDYTFKIRIEAPKKPGDYDLKAQMARNRTHFGRVSATYTVRVRRKKPRK